jgi:hypothetical protein
VVVPNQTVLLALLEITAPRVQKIQLNANPALIVLQNPATSKHAEEGIIAIH